MKPVEPKKDVVQIQKLEIDYDDEIYYCRGMSSAMRKRMREKAEARRKQQEEQQQKEEATKPKSEEKKGLIQKIKGWFS